MNTAFTMQHLLDWHLLSDSAWESCLDSTLSFRNDGASWRLSARGKSLGMIFFNPSLRTRTSMELAAAQLGACATTLTPGQGTWGFSFEDGVVMDGPEAEHIQEAVGVLSRYYDAIGVRLFASMTDYEQDRSDALLHRFARASTVPVINLESAFFHPCQSLADAGAMMNHFDGRAAGKKFVLAWTQHPKALPMAVPNSALLTATRLGMHVVVARPETHPLDEGIMAMARATAAANGGSVVETANMENGLDGADVVYAKAWGGSMAYSDPAAEIAHRTGNAEWRITEQGMALTNGAAFMHCLPVRRNVVVDDAVLDGPNAIHLEQAEFRLHAQKAILEHVWDLKGTQAALKVKEEMSWN